MTTLFCDITKGAIYEWNEKLTANYAPIKTADPISVEYKRIKIVSKKFNKIGTSKVMITNNVKTTQTKTQALDSVTYYDDNAKPIGKWNKLRSYVVQAFDPTQYGDPVCYYNSGYANETIIIASNAFVIEEPGILCDITNFVSNILSTASTVSSLDPIVVPYITVGQTATSMLSTILTDLVKNKQLTNTHVIEFNNIDPTKPFLPGTYLCFPNASDLNFAQTIIKSYYLLEGALVKANGDQVEEYDGSYFIFEVGNIARPELNDFDFTASSNTLLTQLHQNSTSSVDSFMALSQNSSDLQLVQQLCSGIADSSVTASIGKSMYNHLSPATQSWLQTNLPNVYNTVNSA